MFSCRVVSELSISHAYKRVIEVKVLTFQDPSEREDKTQVTFIKLIFSKVVMNDTLGNYISKVP